MKLKSIFSVALVIMFNTNITAMPHKTKFKANNPWLDSLIVKGKYGTSSISSITSYIYKEKLVYLVNFDAGCCDQYSAVLKDENGKTLCHPFGGISGKGDMQCTDFIEKRGEGLSIWVNENPSQTTIKKEKSFKMEKQ